MRRLIVGGAEFVFISGLICVALFLLPWVAWKWLTEPRMWRDPKDVGRGFYEHP